MSNYSDCRTILEQALASPLGLKVTFGTEAEAIRFRLRCNLARVEDRKAAKAMFEVTDAKHNKSQFDGLVLRLRGTDVMIEHEKPAVILAVEELK